jgi:hypothetical protein
MPPTVRRFWFEFDLTSPESQRESTFACLSLGVGVTGFDVADCLWMIRDLPTVSMPPIRTVTPDVSLVEFAARVPGLGVPVWRGVWFPPDNLHTSGLWRPSGASRAINPSIWVPNPPGRWADDWAAVSARTVHHRRRRA